jgi:hypothetical protein
MTRLERIKAAAKNASKEIQLKKAMLHKSGDSSKSLPSVFKPLTGANKADLPKDEEDVIYRTIIANTYNYKDSHDDVHLNNVFKKTIEETEKIFFFHDHEFKLTSQVGVITKSYEQEVTWREVGLDIDGKTMALLHDVRIEKAKNTAIFDMYKNGEIDQHSVGMQYVKIRWAADDVDDKEAYALYTSILDLTGMYNENKDETKEDELEIVLQKFGNIEDIDKICNKYKDSLSKEEPLKDTLKNEKTSENENKELILLTL